MKKSPSLKEYQAMLVDELEPWLPSGFERDASDESRFVRRLPGLTQRIRLTLSHRFFMNLTYGVSFDAFQPVYDALLNEHDLDVDHIHTDTLNIHSMKGLSYLPKLLIEKSDFLASRMELGHWRCDRDVSPKKTIRRAKGVIKGVIEPFFNRFSDIQPAWQSLRDQDGWIHREHAYDTVFAFGALVGDWEGIEKIKDRWTQKYNEAGVARMENYLKQLREFFC